MYVCINYICCIHLVLFVIFAIAAEKDVGSSSSELVDWSRSARSKRLLAKAGSHCACITDYFHILDDIEKLVKRNDELSKLLQSSVVPQTDSQTTLTPVLQRILENATENSTKLPTQRRHPMILKKFAVSLFIYAGPLAYEFIHSNMPEALPSLSLVKRIVHNEYQTIGEGDFRFDCLLDYLVRNNVSKLISIGEDATRVISRVEYDSETNRCVGFVLPLDKNGLPMNDEFLALSFESMEKMFKTSDIAKYAYVYMAQPFCSSVPPFCLACLGTNNKFTAKDALLRWQYIVKECKKRSIDVVSFGGDGDSRLLKAMKISYKLYCNSDPWCKFAIENDLKIPNIQGLGKYFDIQHVASLAFVQDTVHIAVKLKARLLTPSIVLPLGKYVAGSHHIRMIKMHYAKDQHGLREKDVDHRDKQNFDAVVHMIKSSSLLDNIPDAVGTKCFIEMIKYVVDSFLNKQLSPLTRIQMIWYANIFVRYWRKWIELHPQYNIKNNFLTQNAFTCIELNAHALVLLVITLRDNFDDNNFIPWMLGSQSCEKTFRAARSMSTTFSTIINFGVLGLLRRLHRLQIQAELQTETEVKHPSVERHKCKDGIDKYKEYSFKDISNEDIAQAIEEGHKEAQETAEKLGMSELLKKTQVLGFSSKI